MSKHRKQRNSVRWLAVRAAGVGALATIPLAAFSGTASAVDPGPGIGVDGPGVFVPRPDTDPGLGVGVPGPGVVQERPTDPGPGIGVDGPGVFVPRAKPVLDPGLGIGVPGPGVFIPRTGSADLGAPGLGLLPGLGFGLPGIPGHPFLR